MVVQETGVRAQRKDAVDAGVLPVKRLDRAKNRLREHFSDADRADLAHALFEDALRLCRDADFLRWWIVSDDGSVLENARERGFDVIEEAGAGLNAALGRAAVLVSGAGALSMTVVPADVPMAARSDLIDLLDTGATSDMVIVPSRNDGGTNALYLRPPDLIDPQFGPGSFKAHVELAERRRLRCSILMLPRLELDIDTMEDVDAFLAAPRDAQTHTEKVLRRLRLR
jgi:2-phospho-L-lactate/phosphoenolpyruvate guanylyltransferase